MASHSLKSWLRYCVDLNKQNLETRESSQSSLFLLKQQMCAFLAKERDLLYKPNKALDYGFAYMVSAYDLINTKKSTRRQTKKSTQKIANSSSGNGLLSNSGDVCPLFRAPSRASGLKLQPFTVKATPKRKRQCKRSKEVQKTKEVKINIIRLPDIN